MGSGGSKPAKTVRYNVEANNWMKYIGEQVNNRNLQEHGLQILRSKPYFDPAYGCNKNYTSTYKCSTSPEAPIKSIDIAASADGKEAIYDCRDIYNIAVATAIFVNDDGSVVIKNTKTDEVFWSSGTSQVGLPTEQYKAKNSKFQRNYMIAGETLFAYDPNSSPNEFIGNTNGSCFVALVRNGSDNLELRINYPVASVSPDGLSDGLPGNDTGFYGKLGDIGQSTPTSNMSFLGGTIAVYKIINFDGKQQPTGAQGKNLYIDFNLNKQIIPNSMITGLNNQYTYVGNFSQDGRHEIGSVSGSNAADCQNSCNKNDSCWGFVYNEQSKSCSLKSSDMFPNDMLRKLDYDSKMYVRGMKVNSDNSCSKNSTVVYQDVYEQMPNGATMTPQTACNLRSVTREQRAIVKEKQDNLMKVAKKVKMHASDLKQKNTALAAKLVEQLEKYQNAIGDYTGVKHEIEVEQDNYQQVNAMASSSETEMISNNYQYLAFTGLAALGVVAAIKATN